MITAYEYHFTDFLPGQCEIRLVFIFPADFFLLRFAAAKSEAAVLTYNILLFQVISPVQAFHTRVGN